MQSTMLGKGGLVPKRRLKVQPSTDAGGTNAATRSRNIGSKTLGRRIFDQRYLLLMLAPVFLLTLVFTYKPILGWYLAFSDHRIGFGIFEGRWAGLKYFEQFFGTAGNAYRVIRNTLAINIGSMVVHITAAVAFAVLVSEIPKQWYRRTVQTLTLFPFFISWVIAYVVFQSFFSANTGMVNIVLIRAGIIERGIDILGNAKFSLPLMISVGLWKSLGYSAVIFLAAIAGIDQAQYEAAEIDGAKRFHRIWNITLPGLASTIAVILIINSGHIFRNNFGQFRLFTNATNRRTMEVFATYVYRYGLENGRFSYATAVSMFNSVISLVLLAIVNTASKKFNGRSLF